MISDQKTKDHEPANQEPHEGLSSEEIDNNGAERPDTSDVKDITKEASHRDADGFLRQTLRGDESKGDADARDVAGATDFEDTPHGRE